MHSLALFGLLGSLSLVSAAPTASLTKKSTCTFTSASQATASASKCSSIILKNIAVPAGETLDMSGVEDGTTITFAGTTTFGYKEWSGPLLRFGGKQITINQESGAVINGEGSRWWDGKGTNGGKTKPKFMYIHNLEDSTITGLSIKNTPAQAVSVQATNVYLIDMTIDNSAGDSEGGHNTDGFDISDSTGVYIRGATVKNQDDCLAINSGENIEFSGGYCSGGHGLSIGSIGGRSDNIVKNVTIESSTVTKSANGVRIKTIYDDTGAVSDVTFSDIQLSSISDYGIVIEQDYENGSPTGTPSNGIDITDIKVKGITGSVDSDATRVYILCGSGSCTDWTWSGVDITGGKKSSKCKNVPSGASC
ncbi:hypothetical protein P175DRAFT_0515167 [Aspergillus ochraceoroseus IBT 24754]|uniref:endo-polygalacturonase n=3 Tax=Aspergillus subgen. Nidulantes TaxID=2720870 RepID=A0A0F8W515_9EURO|nr:uncharacterized protein P175DRAFT_0515167 [Aspergillus ochraceoroseus IBT 24754]KKK12990.1 extracellular polygalacturonase [Aspergillus rambellii]KKK24945.1 extracellular polygalacturonase [Aspergillus ochraceoroseus]PTU23243.1 hypothetical protein P175DRAFT_0515167 [Aspergillus ochraceoroseus IBT 24754]